MTDIGVATLQVFPTARGITRMIDEQIIAPLARGGREAGDRAGQGIADGIRGSTAAVERASQQITSARGQEASAADRAQAAERDLAGTRTRAGGAVDGQARGEEDLAQARQRRAGDTGRARDAEEDLARAARRAGDETAAGGRDGASALGGLKDKAGEAADQLKGVAVAAAGIGGIGSVIADAADFDVIGDRLAASLGATGQLAKDYGDTAGKVYSSGFGASMDDAASAVGIVASSFATLGFEGEASLETVSQRALAFADVFGTDVSAVVQTTSQLVTNGLAADSTQAFDLMTTAFQRVPAAMRDELPEILDEYGTNFRALGFDGQSSFNLLVTAADQGKFALDKTGDALKEFTIRGSDMSEASAAAYAAIGLNAQEMSDKVAAGGAGAQEALRATAQGLLGIESPSERANTAIALFGTPLEDLSVDQIPQFLEALAGGEDRMSGFAGATDEMSTTLGDNATARLETFKRSVQTGLVEALGASIGWISDNSGMLTQLGIVAGVTALALGGIGIAQGVIAAGGLMNWIRSTTAATWLFNSALLANPLTWVALGIAAVVAAVVIMWNKWDGFRNFVTAAWDGIKSAFSAAWGFIQPVLAAFGEWFTGTAVPAVLGFWHGVIEPAFSVIGTVISFFWNTVVKPVFDLFAAVFGIVGAAVMLFWHGVIEPAFQAIGFVFQLWWAGVQVVWELFKLGLSAAGDVVMWLWNSVIVPAFSVIGAVISGWWTGVVQPVWDAFTAGLGFAGDKVMWLWNSVIVPAFDGIKGAVSAAWDFIKPVFDNIGTGIEAVGAIAGRVGDTARGAFGGVADIMRQPLRVIGGLLANVPEKILGVSIPGAGTVRAWGATLQGLAGGGVAGRRPDGLLWGPGTGTSDSILGVGADGTPTALVSAGEGVVTESAMQRGGDELVAALNAGWTPPADWLDRLVGGGTALVRDGDYTGQLAPLGIDEDHQAVAGVLGARSLLVDGDYTGNLYDATGIEEDSQIVAGALGARDLLVDGDYTGNFRDAFGQEEDSPVVDALLKGRAAAIGAAGLAAGDYRGILASEFGIQEDDPAVDAALDLRDLLKGRLPGFADGGVVGAGKITRQQLLDQARGIEGVPYVWGGWDGSWGTDCSGAQARAANLVAYGDTETGGRFATGTQAEALAARGALPGLGGPDDYSIGWFNGGPYGGHTAGTLPGGTGFEMGGGRGDGQFGGPAAKADDPMFTDHAHFPASMFAGPTTAVPEVSTPTPSYQSPTYQNGVTTTPVPTGAGAGTAGPAPTSGGSASGGGQRLKTFQELGSDLGGIIAGGIVETFGIPDWIADPNKLLQGDDGSNVRTSGGSSASLAGATSSPAPSAAAAGTSAPTPAPAPALAPASSSTGVGAGDATVAVPVDPSGLTGSDLYSHMITRTARDMGLDRAAAVIGNAVGLVESEMLMYANSTVPESLSFPHDAVGSDSDSLNYMQQRPSQGWGTVPQLMDPAYPAKAFFDALVGVDGWQSMDPGVAAQSVQRSAFPDRYSERLADADAWVTKAGLFDTGGWLPPGGVAISALTKPEPLLPESRWAVAEANISAVDKLVAAMNGGGRRGGDTFIANGYTAGDLAGEWRRQTWARTGGYDGRGW
ncbi:hypothetical protein [Skermania piniformis]|uniref:Phage tail tape measure protein domain-containing protein n=1 Tax=Skermania pinensis TaxID=39122 RepID=A0ABX8SAE7_9ACTN|nr:hypothetical protein [Skermania piniformis]QXQ14838.1 hypothetical protein KV203_05505 [Skermania piniformis]